MSLLGDEHILGDEFTLAIDWAQITWEKPITIITLAPTLIKENTVYFIIIMNYDTCNWSWLNPLLIDNHMWIGNPRLTQQAL